MGEYGSGLTSGQCFMMDKERIKKAFQNMIVVDEDENGFVYEPCTKKEAEEYILSAFDNAVHQCLQALASGRAQERIINDLKPRANANAFEIMNKYMKYRAEEENRYQDYVYEIDKEIERYERLNTFTVIQGAKDRPPLNEYEKHILYCMRIMQETGELKDAKFEAVLEFCHTYTQTGIECFRSLKEKGYIDFNEGKSGKLSKFKVIEEE